MKIIYNKLIPFKGFWAITILNMIFVREEYRRLEGTPTEAVMINHESIHFEQEKELGFIFFYILYLLEWLVKLCFYGKKAYHNISFEREAYANECDAEYLKKRKRYNWIKLIPHENI